MKLQKTFVYSFGFLPAHIHKSVGPCPEAQGMESKPYTDSIINFFIFVLVVSSIIVENII